MARNNDESLLSKYLWQMTGEEFLRLHMTAESRLEDPNITPNLIYGIQDLSKFIGCSESTIYDMKRMGIIDKAIISHVGRKFVFDGDKARALINKYQNEKAK